MFVLSSDITIGSFRFSGVNEVQIQRSIHSIVETASIRIPSIARVISNGKVVRQSILLGKQFNEGDAVTIKLGYNGELNTEFRGFVSRCDLNMPLEIKCEGYSWLLRKNNIDTFYRSITVKDILEAAVAGLPGNNKINVQCAANFELSNVQMGNKSGFDVINSIQALTDGALTCFFIQPDTLWCGTIYTQLADGSDPLLQGTVSYRPGYNALKENSLVIRDSNADPVEVRYTKKKPDGTIVSFTSSVFKDAPRRYSRILNSITNEATLTMLANEKAHKMNYTGYEGSVTAFLQPYCTPGLLAKMSDARYPERDGSYLVEGTHVAYGIRGARRIVNIGPRIGYSK